MPLTFQLLVNRFLFTKLKMPSLFANGIVRFVLWNVIMCHHWYRGNLGNYPSSVVSLPEIFLDGWNTRQHVRSFFIAPIYLIAPIIWALLMPLIWCSSWRGWAAWTGFDTKDLTSNGIFCFILMSHYIRMYHGRDWPIRLRGWEYTIMLWRCFCWW